MGNKRFLTAQDVMEMQATEELTAELEILNAEKQEAESVIASVGAEIADATVRSFGKNIPVYPGRENPIYGPQLQVCVHQYDVVANFEHGCDFKKNSAKIRIFSKFLKFFIFSQKKTDGEPSVFFHISY